MKNVIKEEIFILIYSILLYIIACFAKYYFSLNYVYSIWFIVGIIIEIKIYKVKFIGDDYKEKGFRNIFIKCISLSLMWVSIDLVFSNLSNVITF